MFTPTRICLLLALTAIVVTVVSSVTAVFSARIASESDASTQPVNDTPIRRRHRSKKSISHGWPNLFGPKHISVSAEHNLATMWPSDGPPEKWRRNIGSGYSSPVCFGKRLVLLHRIQDEEIVECFDTDSGASVWEHRYLTEYECRFDYSSGPYSTPVIDGSRVYAVSAEGTMRCLDMADGRLIWQREFAKEYTLPEGLFAVGASPLLEQDRLIFNLGAVDQDAGIIAIDARNGETLWTTTDQGASYATPIAATIHGQRFVFVVTFEGLVALDPIEGEVFWSYSFRPKGSQTVNATSPIVAGDLVLMVTGPGPGGICFRLLPDGNFEIVWRDRRVLDSQFNNLTYVNGYVYGYTSSRQGGATLNCVEMATGNLRWQHQSQLGRGSLLTADGKLILWGEHGHLGLVDTNPERPVQRSMTSRPLLEAPCYSAPALHERLLYLRNETTLLCLDLRQLENN